MWHRSPLEDARDDSEDSDTSTRGGHRRSGSADNNASAEPEETTEEEARPQCWRRRRATEEKNCLRKHAWMQPEQIGEEESSSMLPVVEWNSLQKHRSHWFSITVSSNWLFQCVTSAYWNKQRHEMLVSGCFGKHLRCYLQGKLGSLLLIRQWVVVAWLEYLRSNDLFN